MAGTDFTVTAEERPMHPDDPAVTAVYHDIADASGQLVAVGMTDTECLEALAARGGPDATVKIRKGALGCSADETTTIAPIGAG
jgi:hypothetical protein